ncbi:BQ5605_C006g03744 [Microbotryum silenes-dioicae]|uniref:ATP-dependent DNA helicase n=1 Tax=Microbotryum silenes-dioicae TaxID=796604 RepID=A0A2X0M949_9BASI|nr:BQ5605_C006g03744 [Microbotryum silenes-dioicae]
MALRPLPEGAYSRHDLGPMDLLCPKCSAFHWDFERLGGRQNSEFRSCCDDGKVELPKIRKPPNTLLELLTGDGQGMLDIMPLFFGAVHLTKTPCTVCIVEKLFRERILAFNENLAMASFGTSQDYGMIGAGGPPSFYLSGNVYHRMGTLAPAQGSNPVFAQILFVAPSERINARIRFNGPSSDDEQQLVTAYRQTLPRLDEMMLQENRRAQQFLTAREFINHEDAHAYQLSLLAPRNRDPRRYNLPTQDEVAVILPGDETEHRLSYREIVVRLYKHPAVMSLTYPLLLPFGEDWYQDNIPFSQNASTSSADRRTRDADGVLQRTHGSGSTTANNPQTGRGGSKHVTPLQFNAYYFRIWPETVSFPTLFLGGRLFQKFVANAWALTEQERLRWITTNQKTLRAEEYSSLQASLAEGIDPSEIGKRVILPSSYPSSPRNMVQLYQDAMAIVRAFGAPDLFITMTCNPAWPEIINALLPGQTASNRPDIVARVFQGKLTACLHGIYGDHGRPGVFGRVTQTLSIIQVVAHVHVIKFQKRGLPHAHILLILHPDDKPKTNEDFDQIVTVEIPDREKFLTLFETITNSMLHCQCNLPGQHTCHDKNGKCSKGFPKQFQDRTTSEDGGYPHYRRRNLHQFIKFPGTGREEIYTDANVVPTNPWMASKYSCHINVEIANGVAAVKYLYKYVYKGHDRTLFTVEAGPPRNEVKDFLNARYVCAPEAMHRLFQYQMHGQKPAVTRLALHLPNEQQVRFDPEDGPPTTAAPPETTLTAFVKLCATVPPVPKTQNLLYIDVPRSFRWDLNNRAWQERKRNTPAIGRMYFCGPEAGERYYLRLLLLNVPSPTSFAQLRTFNGTEFKTFREACVKRGLLRDNTEANRCLTEAAVFHSGHQLRHLCAMLLTADGGVSNAAELWETHHNSLSDDAEYHLRMRRGQSFITPEHISSWALLQLDQILQRLGTSLCDHGLPLPTATFENELELSRLMMEERSTPEEIERMNREWMKNLEAYTVEQRHAFDTICDSVFNVRGKTFFINAPGGTGKTFLETTILSRIRSENKYALAVASAGIAALLLPKGRTAHSRFKIPIDIFDDSTCNVHKQGQLAELFRACELIVWDEAPMQHRRHFELVNKMLQDVRTSLARFGGITVLLAGDPRQCLPVVPKASPTQILDACIMNADFWGEVQILHLGLSTKTNMRLLAAVHRMTETELAKSQEFADWLLKVGDGSANIDGGDSITLPDHLCLPVDSRHKTGLINHVYPLSADDLTLMSTENKVAYFRDRAILAPKNADVDELNNMIIKRLPGGSIILTGDHAGQTILLPRITLKNASSADLPLTLYRTQFPIRLAMAMTINKSQGQSLGHVGVCLENSVFSHGQLYVALSRASNVHGVKVLLPTTTGTQQHASHNVTDNIVFTRIFDSMA